MDFKIQDYLEEGVEYILKDSMRACIRNPKEIIYLLKFSKHARKATKIRQKHSKGQMMHAQIQNL